MNNIFDFFRDVEYTIVLINSQHIVGIVAETFDNGIMMEDGTRIPEDKILFFRANLGTDGK